MDGLLCAEGIAADIVCKRVGVNNKKGHSPSGRWRCRKQSIIGRTERLKKRFTVKTVVRIFPNEGAALRLISVVLMEIDETWTTGSCYLDMAKYWL